MREIDDLIGNVVAGEELNELVGEVVAVVVQQIVRLARKARAVLFDEHVGEFLRNLRPSHGDGFNGLHSKSLLHLRALEPRRQRILHLDASSEFHPNRSTRNRKLERRCDISLQR